LAETFTTYYHSPVGLLKITGTQDYISEVSFHDVTQKNEGNKKHLPPMLIQPYIENAVWHGLRYKESKGNLDVHIGKDTKGLKVEITDDGIGRKKSTELKTENQKKHNSTGLKNIQERLHILNTIYKTSYRVAIEDLPADGGTRVTISLPLQNGKHV